MKRTGPGRRLERKDKDTCHCTTESNERHVQGTNLANFNEKKIREAANKN